jgi:ribosomal protein L19E
MIDLLSLMVRSSITSALQSKTQVKLRFDQSDRGRTQHRESKAVHPSGMGGRKGSAMTRAAANHMYMENQRRYRSKPVRPLPMLLLRLLKEGIPIPAYFCCMVDFC